jgi:ketosteroid isomerase-like protein
VTAPARPDPADAVRAWWGAMGKGDVEALAALALEDVMSAGGPAGRELGRASLLQGAAAFFASGRVAEWRVEEVEVRDHGEVAVCSYRWSERGEHMGAPFALAGIATDVLVLRGGGWRLQAHHVTMEGVLPA